MTARGCFHGMTKDWRKILNKPGDFIIRQDRRFVDQFLLSIKTDQNIVHILLLDSLGKVRVGDQVFNSIEEFIALHLRQKRQLQFDGRNIQILNPVNLNL